MCVQESKVSFMCFTEHKGSARDVDVGLEAIRLAPLPLSLQMW